MADDDFKLVTGKKAGRRRRGCAEVKNAVNLKPETKYTEEDLETLAIRVSLCEKELQQSSYLKSFTSILTGAGLLHAVIDETHSIVQEEDSGESLEVKHTNFDQAFLVDRFVCYGIGNFTACAIARHQLALCVILKKVFQVPMDKALIFDPLFSAGEKAFLIKLGFTVLEENEEGKHPAGTSTLFYMPHCGKALYNNLLWANWGPKLLRNVAIIGNSFNYIRLNTPSRILQEQAGYLVRIADLFTECAIPNTFIHSDIFNNTSLHMPVMAKEIDNISPSFWQDRSEPVYDDMITDIIVN